MSRRASVLAGAVIAALLLWPFLPHVPHDVFTTVILASVYLIPALSLVLLIGMIGQISLCQATLVGMGAFVAARGTLALHIHFPLTLLVGTAAGGLTAVVIGLVALRVRGLYLAVATMIFAYVADQYLFTKGWLVQSQSGTSIPFESIGKRGTLPYFDLGNAKLFYYIALAVAVTALYLVANLRDSRIGRAWSAIRGSEVAAASLGIDVMRFKLLGFACAGALAGLGGALTLVGQRTVAPSQFDFTNSLFFLSIAVVGGVRSLGGALASSLLFATLVGEIFFRNPTLANYLNLVSSGLLIVVLLFFRGGLGALPEKFRAAKARLEPRYRPVWERLVRRWGPGLRASTAPVRRVISPAVGVVSGGLSAVGRGASAVVHVRRDTRKTPDQIAPSLENTQEMEAVPTPVVRDVNAPIDVIGLARSMAPALASEGPGTGDTDDVQALVRAAADRHAVAGEPGADNRREPVLLSAEHITVRFGGLVAVNDASMQVGAGEIVGLIGPNGAGKTTLFNSILGLNEPTEGTVHLFGQEVTTWGVHQRAALGIGRTFQVLQLFGDLDVFDNLLVATHLQSHVGIGGATFVTRSALIAEREARERVHAVLKLMELERVANEPVASLPFGTLRLVEIARTLVTGARLVCFDEAASGLDSAETERLIEWFRLLREIGVTLLVIEHDVDMVVRLCDYIYVLDQGKLIASGVPQDVQRDPNVIASYLGTSAEVVPA